MVLTRAEIGRRYNEAHPGRAAENMRRYRANHPELREKRAADLAAWRAVNPERVAEHHRLYVGAHPEYSRKIHLRRKYNLSPEDFDAMLGAQGGRCAICPTLHRKDKPLHVDHDHRTGKVRGLLCEPCNQGLGRFEDDPETLASAIAYLEERT